MFNIIIYLQEISSENKHFPAVNTSLDGQHSRFLKQLDEPVLKCKIDIKIFI